MADLSAFATKDSADEGVILPVRINGLKLPIAIKVYGSDSDVVKEFDRAKVRKLMKTAKKNNNKGFDDDEIDEMLDDQDEGVILRIGGVYAYDWKKKKVVEGEETKIDGRVIGNDHDSYEYLLEKIPALKEWIKENSDDRDNFLSAGKKN